jgi:quercetin dioxygenase-like cupin family protein
MIHDILTKLETAENPVAQVIQKNDCGKTMVIAFKKGMVLKEHKTDISARLIVIKGEVIFKINGTEEVLKLYDEKIIPINELHSVVANEESLCLLFK